MPKRFGHAEQESEPRVERTSQTIGEFLRSIEKTGRRVLRVLGPAMLIGSPAFAAEAGREVTAGRDATELRCDATWINSAGESVGTVSMDLPSNLVSAGTREEEIPVDVRHEGACTDATPLGVLSAKSEKPTTSAAGEQKKDIRMLAREVVSRVSNQGFNAPMLGGEAYGWKFQVPTGVTDPDSTMAKMNLAVTVGVIIDKKYGLDDTMRMKLPDVQGGVVYVKLTPKK